VAWLATLTEAPGLPGFALLELMRGARDRAEMVALFKDLELFQVYWPTPNDCQRVVNTYTRARLSSGLSAFDVVIGESAVGLGATLCTFDKQMQVIPGLVVEQPYTKS